MEILGFDFEDDAFEEARRSWELGKMLGLSSPNEIDIIWAMAKSRRERKDKKNDSSRGNKRGRKRQKNNV